MRRLTLTLFVSLTMAPGAFGAVCESLDACIRMYPSVARTEPGISKPEADVARAVQGYGRRAIPDLLRLLEHDDKGVRRLAGYTLRDISGLGPEHLGALVRARAGGDGWIPPAIARIGTPEAIAYLADDLRKNPRIDTQVTYAFKILGAAGAPAIAEMFACTWDCDEQVLFAASFVLHDLGEEAVGVIPRLLEIAGDSRFTLQSRRGAVAAIGDIGPAGAPFEARLIDLRAQDPSLTGSVDQALLGIGSSEVIPSLVEALSRNPEWALTHLSELGSQGYEAGPAVLAYLDDPDWDLRVLAADTLGRIGYSPAWPQLSAALDNGDDWKMVYASSLALARLSEKGSIGALELVRVNHWYPPVRAAAASAIDHVRSGAPVEDDGSWRVGAAANSPRSCEANQRMIPEQTGAGIDGSRGTTLRDLSYEIAIHSYGAREGTEPDDTGIIEVTPENMVEYVEHAQQTPDVALKVENGWLAGSDRGEWGGELVFISDAGESTILYEGNIEDVHPLGGNVVATAGLAHLTFNGGWLLRIDEAGATGYSATEWKRLPGAPSSSWLTEGQELRINTYGGGSVVVDETGDMRMADCQN